MATPAQWIAGARPRTLPAAISPVVLGTAAAAAIDKANLGLAVLALLVSVGLQVGRQLRQRLLRRDPWHRRPSGSGRSGSSVSRLADPGNVRIAAFGSFGFAALMGLALVALSSSWVLIVLGAAGHRGRLALHRRRQPLRLPRAR